MTTITLQSSERTVLILDDEEHVRAALYRTLRRDGYLVLSADSLDTAVGFVHDHHPGVVISDFRMPEIVGTDFLARVRDRYPDTMRILLSAQADEEAVSRAIATGAVHKLVEKPWNDEELRAIVRSAFVALEAGAA